MMKKICFIAAALLMGSSLSGFTTNSPPVYLRSPTSPTNKPNQNFYGDSTQQVHGEFGNQSRPVSPVVSRPVSPVDNGSRSGTDSDGSLGHPYVIREAVSTEALRNIEQVSKISNALKMLRSDRYGPIVQLDRSQKFSDIFNKENIEDFIKGQINNSFFQLLSQMGGKIKDQPNDEQIKVVQEICTNPSGITILEGVPGAGKTSGALKWIVGIFNSVNPNSSIYVSAPNAGGMKAAHDDFGSDPVVKDGIFPMEKLLDHSTTLANDAFVIVDECYLMNRDQLQKLLALATAKNWRLLLTGDSLQNLPQDNNVYGLFPGIKPSYLSASFRALTAKERNFVTIVQNNSIDPTKRSKAMETGLRYLYGNSEFGNMERYLIKAKNNFSFFRPDPLGHLTHIKAAAAWAKFNLDTTPEKNTMIVAHQSDIDEVKDELKSLGVTENDVNKIVKTSLESQGGKAHHVALILNKQLTQAEIYVALSRQTQDSVVIASIGNNLHENTPRKNNPRENNPQSFAHPDDAIDFPYSSQ
jgi:hypothetical protein